MGKRIPYRNERCFFTDRISGFKFAGEVLCRMMEPPSIPGPRREISADSRRRNTGYILILIPDGKKDLRIAFLLAQRKIAGVVGRQRIVGIIDHITAILDGLSKLIFEHI